jgi:hypothetical protein
VRGIATVDVIMILTVGLAMLTARGIPNSVSGVTSQQGD